MNDPRHHEDLGPCCACGKPDNVRNLVMIHKRAPVPGTGWGCVICRIPTNGALAAVCDACLESKAEIIEVCHGFPADQNYGRMHINALADDFPHDEEQHRKIEMSRTGEGMMVLEQTRPGSIVPPHYVPPFGLPLRWQDEITGELPRAINNLMGCLGKRGMQPSQGELKLAVDYLHHYIHAPCWEKPATDLGDLPTLESLRQRVQYLVTVEQIHRWLDDCLEMGLDPL